MRRIITALGLVVLLGSFAPVWASPSETPPGQECQTALPEGIKVDSESGTVAEEGGTLDWDGSDVDYTVNAGFSLDLCIKSGTKAFDGAGFGVTTGLTGEGTLDTSPTEGGGNLQDISHIVYRFVRLPIDCDSTIVLHYPEGVFEEGDLLTVDVAAGLVGDEVEVTATVTNNESTHPDTDLTVSSGTDTVTLLDVESLSDKVTEADELLTLGSDLTVSVSFGADEVFSGDVTLTFTCPTPETPPTPPVPPVPPTPPTPPTPPVPPVPPTAPTLESQAAAFALENPAPGQVNVEGELAHTGPSIHLASAGEVPIERAAAFGLGILLLGAGMAMSGRRQHTS